MYFRAFVSVPLFAVTFESVTGFSIKLDYECVHSKCKLELNECSQESDNSSLTGVGHSYCRSVAQCIHQDIVSGFADPMSCLDGVDHSNMSPAEIRMEQCMGMNGCIQRQVDGPVQSVLPLLDIATVQQDCMSKQCSQPLSSCKLDAVCNELFECLDLHRQGDASRCVHHYTKLDATQTSALQCGWENKCFTGDGAKQLSSPSSIPNPVAKPAQTVQAVDTKLQSIPSKLSFLQVKPLSFLSLKTASEAELQAAEASAEKQAKEAEAAWEQSRKNTDYLLTKIHSEINNLNHDLDRTTSEEKADLVLLEDNRKKEDAELEATEKKLKDLANTKVTLPSASSFLQGFNSDDFLAPLKRAAQQARNFAKQIKEHAFFHNSGSSFLQGNDDKASKALSLAEKALKKLDADIAAQKKQLSEEEAKAKKEEEVAEGQVTAEVDSPASFLQTGTVDYKVAAENAEKRAKAAEAAWEASRRKTDSLLAKVHGEIDSLNSDIAKSTARDRSELSMLEQSRKKEDAELQATEAKLKELASKKIDLPSPASFIQTRGSTLDEILAPLRKAAEDAKHFAEQMRTHRQSKTPSSFVEEGTAGDKAAKALSLAEQALKKLNSDIATQKEQLAEEEKQAKQEGFAPVYEDGQGPASFLQTGSRFDPLSPQALADWRDKFELQLQKAREAAGIHTPMHSSFSQLKDMNFAENDQLKEDERQVERLENQYNQQMQKLKEDNAELLARAKEEMERAKDEENKVKSQLAQTSLLQTSHRYDPAKEEAHIRDLERKWIREAESIVTPPQIVQQDNELQAMIQQQKVKETEAEAQLDQMKQKLNKDIEIMNRDLASNSIAARPSSFLQTGSNARAELDIQRPPRNTTTPIRPSYLQTGSKGPAEAALARAEADLQKLKQQLREETAKLSAMHFDA